LRILNLILFLGEGNRDPERRKQYGEDDSA
jgi:hypothetical protein